MPDMKIMFSDSDYEVYTSLEINGFQHAMNFLELSFGSIENFAKENGLDQDETLARFKKLKEKFDSEYQKLNK